MSPSNFEYDVFLSFASGDQELVTPLWQDLSASGLRVFWSDSVLRDRVGDSWFDIVQTSLERSRHLVVACTPAALRSKWVKREYVAFFTHCYRPPQRVLVPMLAGGSTVIDLPLFLREVEACNYDEPEIIRRLIRRLGGVDIEALRLELDSRNEELIALRSEVKFLRSEKDLKNLLIKDLRGKVLELERRQDLHSTVVMPQMRESISEGTIVKWLKRVGDRVERDEPLLEISTDKVDAEIPAPATGTLSEILVQEGRTVAVNTVVARIRVGS